MRSLRLAAAVLAFVVPFPEDASAAAAGVLIGRTIQDLGGRTVGTIEDLILDVREGRVLYVIVEARERHFTLPIRALREEADGVRLDMDQIGEIARTDDPRFRRAARLIGQPLVNPGDGRIGSITEIEFDPSAGRVEYVVVDVGNGKANFPASVLAHGRFPPLTRWQAEHPPSDYSGNPGFVRREPSPERERLHDHRWPRN